MLRIDKQNRALIPLQRQTMREAGYWERRDIQEMICANPEAFCAELDEKIFFVGSEVRPTDFVQDRIDLLGIDPDGATVVIELKRDGHKLHLLQTLAYAGMIAKWEPKRFVEQLCEFRGQTFEQAKDEIEDSLDEGDIEAINRLQRIILLAEEFDYEVLVTAEWLIEHYDMDIRCYRISLAKNGNDDFITCTRAYPPPEITDIAIRRRKKRTVGGDSSSSWHETLGSIENAAEAAFFRSELAADRENRPDRRTLTFRSGTRRRYRVLVRQKFAYVRQFGRFENDVEFWADRLGPNAQIRPRNDNQNLRFRLWTEQDFNRFRTAWENDIPQKIFAATSDEDTDEADE